MPARIRNYFNEISILIITGIIILRAPSLFLEPRFWAEEGAPYFSFAYSHPWYQTLLFVPSFGYYSLFVNLSVLLATLVPLPYAPLVTTCLSLFAQITPFVIIWWYNSTFWKTPARKVLLSLIIIFSTSTGEIWLNTIHIHFHFAVTAFLLLLTDMENTTKVKEWFAGIILIFAGLTGTVACFLTPVFIWKAYQERKREYTVQAVIMVLCSLIQFTVFLMLLIGGKLVNRFTIKTDFHLFMFLKNYLINNFLRPIFGIYLLPRYILLYLIIPMILCLAWLFSDCLKDKRKVWIIGAFLLTSGLSTFFSMQMIGGLRYAFAPGVMLLVLISSYIRKDGIFKTRKSLIAAILVFLSISVGIIEYRGRMADFINASWPKWPEEVAIWEKNPDYSLKIWPQWEEYQGEMTLERKRK